MTTHTNTHTDRRTGLIIFPLLLTGDKRLACYWANGPLVFQNISASSIITVRPWSIDSIWLSRSHTSSQEVTILTADAVQWCAIPANAIRFNSDSRPTMFNSIPIPIPPKKIFLVVFLAFLIIPEIRFQFRNRNCTSLMQSWKSLGKVMEFCQKNLFKFVWNCWVKRIMVDIIFTGIKQT